MPNEKPDTARGIIRLRNAARFSAAGFRSAFANEEAFRQETYLAVIAIPLGILLGDSAVEKALLVASVVLLLIVELLNSAIENTVDRISDERHVLAGRAKDQASAAVLLAVLVCTFVWGAILLPQLFA